MEVVVKVRRPVPTLQLHTDGVRTFRQKPRQVQIIVAEAALEAALKLFPLAAMCGTYAFIRPYSVREGAPERRYIGKRTTPN